MLLSLLAHAQDHIEALQVSKETGDAIIKVGGVSISSYAVFKLGRLVQLIATRLLDILEHIVKDGIPLTHRVQIVEPEEEVSGGHPLGGQPGRKTP